MFFVTTVRIVLAYNSPHKQGDQKRAFEGSEWDVVIVIVKQKKKKSIFYGMLEFSNSYTGVARGSRGGRNVWPIDMLFFLETKQLFFSQ